ncbi:hypothetical protein J6590_108829 [Homalodisca vitripennis]|nr:hypothetical protein J6590_108829 [Homalodisca vitripennis]
MSVQKWKHVTLSVPEKQNWKTLKRPRYVILDSAALWVWFERERSRGTLLSGPSIKREQQLTASKGWLHHWKKKHVIWKNIIFSEKLSSDVTAYNKHIKIRKNVELHRFEPDQVYNIEESGLNCKMLSTRTRAAQNESVQSTKLAKERITIALCSNANHNHNMPLFVNG